MKANFVLDHYNGQRAVVVFKRKIRSMRVSSDYKRVGRVILNISKPDCFKWDLMKQRGYIAHIEDTPKNKIWGATG